MNEYFPVNIKCYLRYKNNTPFNVFLRFGHGKFTRIFKKDTPLDFGRIKKYMQKGIKEFWIEKKNYITYIIDNDTIIQNSIKSGKTNENIFLQHLNELSSQSLNLILENKIITPQTYQLSKSYSSSLAIMSENSIKPLTSLISIAKTNDKQLLRHLITTAIFSMIIARSDDKPEIEISNDSLSSIALGGFLHDIGLGYADKNFDEANLDMSPEETAHLIQHVERPFVMERPKDGVFSSDVKQTIKEHHEAWDGTGFPNRLKGLDISYQARVVAVADAFSLLNLGNETKEPVPFQMALFCMQQDNTLDPRIVEIFVQLFQPQNIKPKSPIKTKKVA